MDLFLRRTVMSKESTIGPLTIDGAFQCFCLELPWKDNKPGISCIPPGKYRVTVYYSPDRQYLVPLLHGVPDRQMIEMHIGNWAKDTHGCLLVGKTAGADYIGQSAPAFQDLRIKVMNAIDQTEEVWIEIK
jgi:hypothetical protein